MSTNAWQSQQSKNRKPERGSPSNTEAKRKILLEYGAGTLAGTLALSALFPSCSKSSHAQPKIVGGFEVTEATAFGPLLSSTVAITTPSLLFSGKSFCTGTLIGKKTVITAAHCLSDEQGREVNRKLLVFFGPKVSEDDTSGKSVFAREVIARRIHPAYNHRLTTSPSRRNESANDLAVLSFSGEIPQGFAPANLAEPENTIPRGIVLAGFGITGTLLRSADGRLARAGDGSPATVSDTGLLRAVRVALGAQFGGGQVFFVSSPDGRPRGACPGDSGGPAYYQVPQGNSTRRNDPAGSQKTLWVVGGVLSTGLEGIADADGDGNADTNCVGQNFYTDVRGYKNWIAEMKTDLGETSESSNPSKTSPAVSVAFPMPTPHAGIVANPPRYSGKVYWVTAGLSEQFRDLSQQITVALFNDSNRSYAQCNAVAEIDSERSFFIWTLQLRDTLRSNKRPMAAGKITELTLNRGELAEWQARRYQALGVQLFCDGSEIKTELLMPRSINSLAYN